MNEDQARRAYSALVGGRPEEVIATLDEVPLTGVPGLDARRHSWRAQALDLLGRLPDAERAAAEAVRVARRARDADALEALLPLHQRLVASLAASRIADVARRTDAGMSDTPDDVLLVSAGLGNDAAAVLIRKANAQADQERGPEAVATARKAFGLAAAAGAPREQVLALLCEVRAAPERALLVLAQAHTIAERADDHNLITAVAHAARAVGVRLPAPDFG